MSIIYIIIGVVAILAIAGIVFLMMSGSGDSEKISEDEESSFDFDMEKEMENDLKDGELVTKYTEGTGEGIAEVEKLLESDPDNVDLLDWLAFMYYSNNQTEKAIEVYKKALNINPNNENQHYYLANSYYKKGMVDEAIKEWNEVIRLKPHSKIGQNSQQRIDAVHK
ncbi:tetratricopeptide repeat protein [Candidatus Riflebacteria bacterium]